MTIPSKIVIIITMILLAGIFTYTSAISAPVVIINGIAVSTKPIEEQGIIYMPLYAIATALKINIDYDSNLNIIKVEGKTLPGTPLIKDGPIYVPLETVINSIGGSLKISGKESIIRIDTITKQSAIPSPSPTQTEEITRIEPVIIPSPSVSEKIITPIIPTTEKTTSPEPTSSEVPAVPKKTKKVTRTGGIFIPQSSRDDIFSVTVTNLENVEVIKDYYKPKTGNKFVITYVQQQNISNEVQIYTGRFSLVDDNGKSYDYIDGLSNFWLIILRPGGMNFGYLVFEMPRNSQPSKLILYTLNNSPLTIELR